MSKAEVTLAVKQAVQKLYKTKIEPELSYPETRFGDFSTNVAYILASQLGKSPQSLANELSDAIKHPSIQKLEVVDGYLNIHMTDDFWYQALQSPSQPQRKAQKIVVEYGHPNTHKFPHIGHLFSYLAGDAVARLLEAVGHKVEKVNYQGDIGLHVAKCLYVWTKQKSPSTKSVLERMAILQRCYQEGSQLYESSNTDKEAIDQLNLQLYQAKSDIRKAWQETRGWSLEYLAQLEKRLDVEQSKHYYESEVAQAGLELAKQLTGKVFEESDGAVIFPGERAGLHNRVFINSMGLPTYEAKELGLNMQKYRDWQFDLTVIPTAREQNDYFEVVIKAIDEAIPELKGKVRHIGFGFVDLASGKMSSRSGKILTAQELIDVSFTSAKEITDRLEDLDDKERTDITESVALGAIKYGFLKSNLGKNISFDLKRDLSLSGNSGPYIQYAHARASSILNKAPKEGAKETKGEMQFTPDEREILRLLSQFSEIVEKAADDFAPHIVAGYIYKLAEAFNRFYENQRILGSDQESLRLEMARGVQRTLKEGLDLLGIAAPEKM